MFENVTLKQTQIILEGKHWSCSAFLDPVVGEHLVWVCMNGSSYCEPASLCSDWAASWFYKSATFFLFIYLSLQQGHHGIRGLAFQYHCQLSMWAYNRNLPGIWDDTAILLWQTTTPNCSKMLTYVVPETRMSEKVSIEKRGNFEKGQILDANSGHATQLIIWPHEFAK